MARLAPGATRLVSEVRWLGCSVGEVIRRIETWVTRQRRVVARMAGLRLTDTHCPQGLGDPALPVTLRSPGPLLTARPVRR
jgi:hypothetical protein